MTETDDAAVERVMESLFKLRPIMRGEGESDRVREAIRTELERARREVGYAALDNVRAFGENAAAQTLANVEEALLEYGLEIAAAQTAQEGRA